MTPPLSLSSSPSQRHKDTFATQTASDILERNDSKEAASRVRAASKASKALRQGIPRTVDTSATGVKIWSGPSADRPEACSSMMPSISESPLEQDFTIEGKPSKLGCPFASMANKKLSSHAASVLSRYNQGSGGPPSVAASSTRRVDGKESLLRRGSRRASFADPIKAEICGLSDHDEESPHSEGAMRDHLEAQENAEVGVCPIRFLEKHSPEEMATYFERHKHELPRSHEVCVKRYQSNEKQIRELDAKYGNLVSMIQGLGAKHKDMLPEEPADDEVVAAGEDSKSAKKVRKWASSVSAQAPAGEDEEDRQPHFERPLRDIRVGESPSRPWGIPVPAKYLEKADSVSSSKPVPIASPPIDAPSQNREAEARVKKPPQCPFGFGQAETPVAKGASGTQPEGRKPVFVAPEDMHERTQRHENATETRKPYQTHMVFKGPVFFGYGADDAARILQGSSWSGAK